MRRIVERLQGTHRLLLHAAVQPNQPAPRVDGRAQGEMARERMEDLRTQFGPDGVGYFLSDEHGTRLIEKARALGEDDLRPQGPALRGKYPTSTATVQRHRRRSESASRTSTSGLSLRLRHGVREQALRSGRDPRRIDTLIRSLSEEWGQAGQQRVR